MLQSGILSPKILFIVLLSYFIKPYKGQTCLLKYYMYVLLRNQYYLYKNVIYFYTIIYYYNFYVLRLVHFCYFLLQYRAVVVVVIGFTTISAYHQCELKSCSWQGALDTKLYDNVFQWLATGSWLPRYNRNSAESSVKHHNPSPFYSKLEYAVQCKSVFF